MVTKEMDRNVANGWLVVVVLFVALLLIGYGVFTLIVGISNMRGRPDLSVGLQLMGYVLAIGLWIFFAAGLFTVQPNEAAVLILFGAYRGSVKTSGFKWANPLYRKVKISQRWRNLNGETAKVNDVRGNPIEIAAVVVWRVEDTAKASFDVDNYEHFVIVQSEAALRHMAMSYPYDTFEGDTHSLRGSTDEVNAALQKEVQERVAKAGVAISETRLSHLAYAAEIAGAMLQRQQAEAVVSARSRIVEGAVGMVEMALEKLEKTGTIRLDEERKAAMVSNLMVVLCGHEPARPVINTGTLYT